MSLGETFDKIQKIFMSSPACADGYNTPAQQREDSEICARKLHFSLFKLLADELSYGELIFLFV